MTITSLRDTLSVTQLRDNNNATGAAVVTTSGLQAVGAVSGGAPMGSLTLAPGQRIQAARIRANVGPFMSVTTGSTYSGVILEALISSGVEPRLYTGPMVIPPGTVYTSPPVYVVEGPWAPTMSAGPPVAGEPVTVAAPITQAALDAMLVGFRATNHPTARVMVYELWVDVSVVDQPVVTVEPIVTVTDTLRPVIEYLFEGDPGAEVEILAETYEAGQSWGDIRVFTAAQVAAGGFDPDTTDAVWERRRFNVSTPDGYRFETIGPLYNDESFVVYVRGAQEAGGDHWSEWDSEPFDIALTDYPPPAYEVTAVPDDARGGIALTAKWRANMLVDDGFPGDTPVTDPADFEGIFHGWDYFYNQLDVGNEMQRSNAANHTPGGTWCLRMPRSSVDANNEGNSLMVACVPGERFAAVGYCRKNTAHAPEEDPLVTVRPVYFDANEFSLGYGVNTTHDTLVLDGTFRRVTGASNAPASAAFVGVDWYAEDIGAAAGAYVLLDDAALFEGGFPPTDEGWAPQTDVRVERSSDGVTWTALRRAAVVDAVNNEFSLFDYEAAPGVEWTYRVQSSSPSIDGVLLHTPWAYSTGSTWNMPDGCTAWIKDPVYPALSVLVEWRAGSLTNVGRAARRGLHEVRGRSTPVVVADRRLSLAGTIVVGAAADDGSLDALLAVVESGRTLLVQAPPTWGWGSQYVSVGDVDVARPIPDIEHRDRRVTLPVRVVAAPAGALVEDS